MTWQHATKKHMPIRLFNRAVYNPLAKLIAGKFLYALVEHTGRRSGKIYTTPVVANLDQGKFYIPLPYGADTDWFLNVKAAGACHIWYLRKLYSATQPQVIDPQEALPHFSAYYRSTFKFLKVGQFLRLEQG